MLKHLDAYKLKWIAIIGMALSHMFYAWWDIMPFWLILILSGLGGLTFPIMSFFVVEGYKHTSNLKKYMLRLFVFGLIALPFHFLVIGWPVLNIMFMIVWGLFILILYDKIKIRILFWLLYIIVIVPISYLVFEYYFIGTNLILMFYIIKNETARRIAPPLFAGVTWFAMTALGLWRIAATSAEAVVQDGIFRNAHFLFNREFMLSIIPFALVSMFVAVLLKNYNGERGKRMKWLFYIMYPLHFAVLAAIAFALGLINLGTFGF